MLASGTVEDLARKISGCLRRSGDPASDPLIAARSIARGLLEFAVADLDPELFQRLLLARLGRLELNQASALDEAMLCLHADLAVWFAQQRESTAEGFANVMGQLQRVLDRPAARSC